jgi:hypothetical protein
VPESVGRKTEEWVKTFKSIPKGKAMVATEKELGLKAVSVSSLVRGLIKKGLLPSSFKVARRQSHDEITIYIINSAGALEGKSRAKAEQA